MIASLTERSTLPNMALTPSVTEYYRNLRAQFSESEKQVAKRKLENTPQNILLDMVNRGVFSRLTEPFDKDDLVRLQYSDTSLHAVRGAKFGDLHAAAVFYKPGDTDPHYHPVTTFQLYMAPQLNVGADGNNGWVYSVHERLEGSRPNVTPMVHGLIQVNKSFESHGFWARQAGLFFPLTPVSLGGEYTLDASRETMHSFRGVPRNGLGAGSGQ